MSPDLRQFKLKRGRGRVPTPSGFKIVQASYYRAIQTYAKAAHELIKARLVPLLGELIARNAAIHDSAIHANGWILGDLLPLSTNTGKNPVVRTDAAMPPGRRASLIIEGAKRSLEKSFTLQKLEKMAEKAAKETAELNRRNLFRQIKAQVGVDLASLAERGLQKRVKQFTAENVALIRSVPQQYFSEVEKLVHAGVKEGTRHTSLADEIEERFSVSESRAALIARDQVLKFNGHLNRVRQTDLGIGSYTWRTAEDERVRKEHDARDGQVYQWDDPPGDPDDPSTGGHPGVAIQCRCWAEPNVEEVLSTLESED